MAVSKVKVLFSCDVQKAWDTVTDLTDWSWRSDLERIEAVSGTEFVEYTKDGYATAFTVTKTEPCRRWEFDMENGNMRGHWTGVFSVENGKAAIEFTEDVTAKKALMRPFVGMYLRKQQARYIADLSRRLSE